MQHLMQNQAPAISNKTMDHELVAYRQESFADLNIVIEMGLRAIGNLFTTIGNFAYLSTISNIDKGRKEVSDSNNWISKLESRKNMVNFVAMRDLIVPIPEGFKGDFPAYAAMLTDLRAPSFKACNDFLSQFQTYASLFVSDKATKLSNKSLENDFKAIRKLRGANEAKVQSFFGGGQAQRGKIGELFESPHDLIPALKQTVANWDAVLRGDQLKTVKAYAETLTSTLKLVEEIQNSGENTVISKAAILNLAQGAREAAEEIEAVGKFFVRSEIASVSAGHIAERLVLATK